MHYNTTRRVVTFTVDDDEFTTKPAIPAGVVFTLQQRMRSFKSDNEAKRDQAYEDLKSTYQKILTADSWELFEPRLEGECDDDTVPIDAMLLMQITRDIIAEGLGKGRSEPATSSQDG